MNWGKYWYEDELRAISTRWVKGDEYKDELKETGIIVNWGKRVQLWIEGNGYSCELRKTGTIVN